MMGGDADGAGDWTILPLRPVSFLCLFLSVFCPEPIHQFGNFSDSFHLLSIQISWILDYFISYFLSHLILFWFALPGEIPGAAGVLPPPPPPPLCCHLAGDSDTLSFLQSSQFIEILQFMSRIFFLSIRLYFIFFNFFSIFLMGFFFFSIKVGIGPRPSGGKFSM